MSTQTRQPAGAPNGGQFAEVAHGESSVTLTAELGAAGGVPVREYHEGSIRYLPTGRWRMTGDDEWTKLCPRCAGTGVYHSSWDKARCWACIDIATGLPTGLAADVKTRTTAELDRKEEADTQSHTAAEHRRLREAEGRLAVRENREALEAAREAERQAALQPARDASKHLDAAVDDKVEVVGTVLTCLDIEVPAFSGGGVDTKKLIVVDAGDGVQVKMFTAAQWAWKVKAGQRVTIAAAVKKHGEFNGFKQTELARPKLVATDVNTTEAE